MNKVRLIYCGISEVVGGKGMAVVQLADAGKHRALSVVCDGMMKYQIGLRQALPGVSERLLPEVLVSMLRDNVGMGKFEICVYNLADGEYKTVVQDTETLQEYPIRISDAILLSLVGDIPMMMEESLFIVQSMPYAGHADRLAIPINTLDTKKLAIELQKAISEEDYRLASQIQDELNRRKETGIDVE